MKITKEQSDELNTWIGDTDDEEALIPLELEGNGKAFPYVGWYWRSVDFTRPFLLYCPTHKGSDVPPWKGFMENNKWDYESFEVSQESYEAIVSSLMAAKDNPSKDTIADVFRVVQEAKEYRHA